jgi:RNA 2',3'-cyclic 3'-phosphodiesterase
VPVRVFIAVRLPEPVKDQIARTQNELRDALPGKSFRWTRPEQFHVTLKFLGNVESDRLEDLSRSVRLACEGFGILELSAAGIGAFPTLRRPRGVWTHVEERRQRLLLLQRIVDETTAGFTSERPHEAFTGHVTMGRCKAIARAETATLARLALTMGDRHFGEWTADDIAIIRSELASGGPRHTTLATVRLAGHAMLLP